MALHFNAWVWLAPDIEKLSFHIQLRQSALPGAIPVLRNELRKSQKGKAAHSKIRCALAGAPRTGTQQITECNQIWPSMAQVLLLWAEPMILSACRSWVSIITQGNIRYSLAGQDTRPSPEGPGTRAGVPMNSLETRGMPWSPECPRVP